MYSYDVICCRFISWAVGYCLPIVNHCLTDVLLVLFGFWFVFAAYAYLRLGFIVYLTVLSFVVVHHIIRRLSACSINK